MDGVPLQVRVGFIVASRCSMRSALHTFLCSTAQCVQSLYFSLLAVHVATSADWLQNVVLSIEPHSNVLMKAVICSGACAHQASCNMQCAGAH